ncbi:MAG: PIN domain-containing protein [Gaiellaceae bacterium]
MGTLLDAFALVAFFEDEPAAPEVGRLIAARDASMSTVNLAEAGQRILRHSDVTSEELRQLVGSLPLALVPYTVAHAWRAAELRARHYHRRDSSVSFADCCLVAAATPADRVATADPAVLRMAEGEGIGTVELPRP